MTYNTALAYPVGATVTANQAPLGGTWLRADGSLVPRTTYPILAALTPLQSSSRIAGGRRPAGVLVGVAYGLGMYVAVTRCNKVGFSYDGMNFDWRTVLPDDNTPNAVIYANGLFVIVGQIGSTDVAYIATSPDGMTWTQRLTGAATTGLASVIFANGQFVAVGTVTTATAATVYTSPTGVTWTKQTIATSLQLAGIAYGAGLYVATAGTATATTSYLTSPDAVTWTARTAPAVIGGLAFGASIFVAGSASGTVLSSPDGITWTSRTYQYIGVSIQMFWAIHDGVNFVTGGTRTHMVSTDGITWTRGGMTRNTVPATSTNFLVSLANGAIYMGGSTSNGFGEFFVTTDHGVTATTRFPVVGGSNPQGRYLNGQFLAVDGINGLYSSGDGITWAARHASITVSNANYITDLAYGAGLYVALTTGQTTLATSPNLNTWTTQSYTATATLTAVGFGNSTFVAFGSNGTSQSVATSPDGVTWTVRTAPGTTATISRVAYVGAFFVAVGNGGTLYISPDGVTWTVCASNLTAQLYDVGYVNSTYVVCGASGQISSSPDGVTWTARSLALTGAVINSLVLLGAKLFANVQGMIFASYNGINWISVSSARSDLTNSMRDSVLISNGTVLCMVSMGQGVNGGHPSLVSYDGASWTSSIPDLPISSVGRYVLCNNRVYQLGYAIHSSADGYQWNGAGTIQLGGLTSLPKWTDIAYNGAGLYVATSTGGAIAASTDGLSWFFVSVPSTNITRVTYAYGLFIAYGFAGTLATSPDGINWTLRTSNFTTNDINKVSYNGSTLVAVGVAGTITTSTDGITWTFRTSSLTNAIAALAFGNGIWMAADSGTNKLSTSPDGFTWTLINLGSTPVFKELAFVGGLFYGIGNSGTFFSVDGRVWTPAMMGSAIGASLTSLAKSTMVVTPQNTLMFMGGVTMYGVVGGQDFDPTIFIKLPKMPSTDLGTAYSRVA